MADYFGLYVIVCNILCLSLTVVTLFGMCHTDDDLTFEVKSKRLLYICIYCTLK